MPSVPRRFRAARAAFHAGFVPLVPLCKNTSKHVKICRDALRYVKICPDVSRDVKICQEMSRRYDKRCQDMSRYVMICQDMSGYDKRCRRYARIMMIMHVISYIFIYIYICWRSLKTTVVLATFMESRTTLHIYIYRCVRIYIHCIYYP